MTELLERMHDQAVEPSTGKRPARLAGRRRPDWLPLAAIGSLILAASPVVLWTCSQAHPVPLVHDIALFVHLGALLVGFGAVLSVDWVAALFIMGKRSYHEMMRAADNAAVPVWAGYAGLVLSGLLLEPDLASPVTQLKLGLVLVIGLNGVVTLGLHRASAAAVPTCAGWPSVACAPRPPSSPGGGRRSSASSTPTDH